MDPKAPTHFGYQTVSASEKTQKVDAVFSSVAARYDLMNDLMSLGIHRFWKRYAVRLADIRSSDWILDLAAGTGDLAKLMHPKLNHLGRILLTDLNLAMLQQGRRALDDLGMLQSVNYLQANAESLPYVDQVFDKVTIGFGLRNVTDIPCALREMCRVLKPGGRLIVLEFSKPLLPLLDKCYDLYSFTLLPWLGSLIVGDADSYRYLAESIRRHPDQSSLQKMILNAGFDACQVFSLTGGIVAVHRAYKY